MDMFMTIVWLILGILLGSTLSYFYFKSSHVVRANFEQVNADLIKSEAYNSHVDLKIKDLHQQIEDAKNVYSSQLIELNTLQNKYSKISVEFFTLQNLFEEQKHLLKQGTDKIEDLLSENKQLFATNAELNANNKSLGNALETQKDDLINLQEITKKEFQNLANTIFEEKSEKFTTVHSEQLKMILTPFQEKITELKNRVNETYDKESKERFSLAEKVKELAELNQQISEDAKKLTRALKGESKTQGNWGEMILESILEKSGLVKGREYFLEHELRDEDNKALYSEFSGKKMRPDAVIKYPDSRTVIIDSKVSLRAFTDLVDEVDTEIYKQKLAQHLSSVKNHIIDLSKKAYDDYGTSLDFVMMFLPSEPAYIAAMQADQNLWNFAYEKRILLLNPSNLITSLKLILDLWKREHQNNNALEIAERGAKLYDKFVGFIENLEKIGKSIDIARNAYAETYKQLYTGNDNLILQTQKIKELGIKNKKNISSALQENAATQINTEND